MEPSEKIANTYLRLNGFFTIPMFSILLERAAHIDILAVRLGNSEEKVRADTHAISLNIDDGFLKLLGASKKDDIGLVVEVKGGKDDHGEIPEKSFEYAKPFFGRINPFRVVFKKDADDLKKETMEGRDHFAVSLNHCLKFINQRFEEMAKIEKQIRNPNDITKFGSWYLSEEFLSELIYLKSLGFFATNQPTS